MQQENEEGFNAIEGADMEVVARQTADFDRVRFKVMEIYFNPNPKLMYLHIMMKMITWKP